MGVESGLYLVRLSLSSNLSLGLDVHLSALGQVCLTRTIVGRGNCLDLLKENNRNETPHTHTHPAGQSSGAALLLLSCPVLNRDYHGSVTFSTNSF